uniref:Uncharacterized protein n=1 Tax=Octopus bimaculoides TaxID=37653 RepID=A0A0L8H8W7_OCTBM
MKSFHVLDYFQVENCMTMWIFTPSWNKEIEILFLLRMLMCREFTTTTITKKIIKK